MPITVLPNVTTANQFWTTERLVTAMYTIMGDNVGEITDTFTLRLWLNMAIVRAATFIRTYKPEYYTMRLEALLNAVPVNGNSTYPYKIIDLKTPIATQLPDPTRSEKQWPLTQYANVIPYQFIDKVIGVQVQRGYTGQGVNLWNGTIEHIERDKFSAICNNLNDQWRQDVIWTYEDGQIMVHAGTEVLASPSALAWYTNGFVELTVLRKPILDDMLAIDGSTSNYYETVDVPDEVIPLVLQYAKEIGLGLMGKQIDQGATATTNATEQSLLTAFGHVPTPPTQ